MAAIRQLLGGKLALITGGGSGIGKAVCEKFAKEGAKVIVADINEDAAKSTLSILTGNGHLAAQSLDVSRSESVQRLFASTQEKFSRAPDVLVNCAGITRDTFLFDMTEQMFDDVIAVNLKGTFLMTQAACKLMAAAKTGGSVVNVSSIVGKVGNIGQTNYAASKAGVVGLTKTVAKEMAQHNIRCNAIMPGFIDTPMVAAVPDKVLAKVTAMIPLRRKGTPEEIAELCSFLASDSSSYITGEVIEITGGLYM